MLRMNSYFYVLATILLMVFGQIIIKWQVLKAGTLPEEIAEQFSFVVRLLFNPWILGGLFLALLSAICWMIAMSKLPLSHAYPFVSLSFVLVLVLSAVCFGESVTWPKILGVSLIVLGVGVSSQG